MRTRHRIFLMGTAQAEPLRISYFIWIGYGPLFVAKEKSFFAAEGVEVELVSIEVHAAAFGGLYSGQVDAIAGALHGIDVWSSLGALKAHVSPADVIRHDLWVE